MGSARSFLGPYTNGEGKPGSWLALDNGGHNNYFEYLGASIICLPISCGTRPKTKVSTSCGFKQLTTGQVYGTVWYGSEPNGDVPLKYKGLINLPSIAKMESVNGRLVQAASLKNDDDVRIGCRKS